MNVLKRYKSHILVGLLAFVAGIYSDTRTPEIKTELKEVVKEKIVTQIKTVKEPNGTVTIEETKVEDRQKDVTVVSSVPKEAKWHVSVDANKGLDLKNVYGLQIERKLAGNFYVGVRVTTAKTAGVILGVSF